MKLVLATVLERHSLRSAEKRSVPTVVRNTFVGPRGGIRMIAAPRAGAATA